MNRSLTTRSGILISLIASLAIIQLACGPYKFVDISVAPDIKTVRIQPIDNKARYTNAVLAPQLTERLKQKTISQTRLNQVNNDNAHLDIAATITDYTFSTSAISGQREATNRLSITVHIIRNDQLHNEVKEYDVSRSFEFSASLSITVAENQLREEILKNLTDEIFNRIFSDW